MDAVEMFLRYRMGLSNSDMQRIGRGIPEQFEREFNWVNKKFIEAFQEHKDMEHPKVAKAFQKIINWSQAHPEAFQGLVQRMKDESK